MSPFKALYGYEPPHLPMGEAPRSNVEAVDALLRERHSLFQQMKEQLLKAQEKMRLYADKKRTERRLFLYSFLGLFDQPYRQITVQGKSNQKLRPKYYGPFEILEKIGKMAYKLNLPEGSQIHPVFQVSQLKARVGNNSTTSPKLPIVGDSGQLKIEPLAILGRRMIKRRNEPVPQILVRWSNCSDADAEDYEQQQFPQFLVEANEKKKGGRMSEMAIGTHLGIAVRGDFDPRN